MASEALRSPLAVTLSVWRALLLREALSRLFKSRAAWLWLLLEPMFHVSYMVVLFATIRVRHVGGIATPLWLIIGLLAYEMFMNTAQEAGSALRSNRALLAYRQVKPVDTIIARAILEGTLMVAVSVILLSGAGLFGYAALPDDPLRVLGAWAGMWICGVGFGLLVSAISELSAELGRILRLLTRPLYILSGVIFPISSLPAPFREWLLLNPLVHGIEATRSGFAPFYHSLPGVSLSYLFSFAVCLLLAGLLMHTALGRRLVMQ